MRATSWFLSFALLLILMDVGWERTRRDRESRTTPATVESGDDARALDGTNGEPPPKP
jgi:hypothetical protein